MSPETSLLDGGRLAQLLFLAVFSVSVSLVLRVAHDWFPFTPTYTSERQWMGWRDVLRWALSGLLLFLAPFAYLTWALVAIAKSGITIPLELPTWSHVLQVISLILLPIPLLGLYDIWQSIVRSRPTLFYSPAAIATIEGRHKTAFTASRLHAFFLGVAWIVGPILLFLLVSGKHAP